MAFLLLHRDDRRREAVQRRPVGLVDAEEEVELLVRDGEPVGGILRRILGAVSYTHLDVYKRQCQSIDAWESDSVR